jgi:tRNA 2-selenouridine synthase
VCGFTGSGKTGLLAWLRARGAQTLDLESLARHRGSAFGGFDRGPQPSHRAFREQVLAAISDADPRRYLWVEHKGEYLGSVGLPPELLAAMRAAPRVEVLRPRPERVRAIVAGYGAAATADWVGAVDRIAPRLGPAVAAAVRGHLRAGALEAAVPHLLDYYDRGYRHGAARLEGPLLARVTATGVPGVPEPGVPEFV